MVLIRRPTSPHQIDRLGGLLKADQRVCLAERTDGSSAESECYRHQQCILRSVRASDGRTGARV